MISLIRDALFNIVLRFFPLIVICLITLSISWKETCFFFRIWQYESKIKVWKSAKNFWNSTFFNDFFVSKVNFFARRINSFSEFAFSYDVSLLRFETLAKARITLSYCSTVFRLSSICLVRHLEAFEAFCRNQFRALSAVDNLFFLGGFISCVAGGDFRLGLNGIENTESSGKSFKLPSKPGQSSQCWRNLFKKSRSTRT